MPLNNLLRDSFFRQKHPPLPVRLGPTNREKINKPNNDLFLFFSENTTTTTIRFGDDRRLKLLRRSVDDE